MPDSVVIIGAGINGLVAANYLRRAGCDVLKAGGTAADAAVAVQAVLGLVEPQSTVTINVAPASRAASTARTSLLALSLPIAAPFSS